ncbi:MAG: ribonuclease P protein component [Verrucomicrobia bacterium]|nr:ribonuclease P protein component [Verrucomicrobiota bacterium]
MRLRFPKAARLATAREFHRVRDAGRSWPGRFFVLGVLCLPDSPAGATPARIGLITSKRVGGAVARNRVRRWLREIVRASRPELRADIWLVLVARRAAAEAGLAELRDEWLRLGRRAGILPAPSPRPADENLLRDARPRG